MKADIMDEVIKIKKKKRFLPFLLGLMIIIFSVIGIVSSVIFVKNHIDEHNSDNADLKAYGKYLTCVVGTDPQPFSDITKAKHEDLLNIALCTLLTDGVKTGQYEVTNDGMVIPAADVEMYFEKLFGKDTVIVHSNVTGYGYTFTFDEAALTYKVPLAGINPTFSPVITDVARTGGLVTLKVGCIGLNHVEVEEDGSLKNAQPDKYLSITLRETENGGYNLISLSALTVGEYAK